MIYLTRLNGKTFYLNAELIQLVEGHRDNTVITLVDNATKYLVKEPAEDVIERIIAYRQRIYNSRLFTELDSPGDNKGV